MQISWPIVGIIGVILLILVIFIIMRNQKDEKEMEQQLNKDFGRPKKLQDNEDTSA